MKAFLRYSDSGFNTKSYPMDVNKAEKLAYEGNKKGKGYYWVEEITRCRWLPNQLLLEPNRS